jgi:signal transduction histidine kinase/CheY-like chemotaxis protein/HPt (histidine-containing phosphotransfer) domain-containing protein
MAYLGEKLSTITSVTKKVIAGFLLVFVAIVLALAIAHFGFSEMMQTVDKLSEPNQKLDALNTIFQEITSLEQTQRAQAISNPRNPYKIYLEQSKAFVNKIDSLQLLEWDSAQQTRLDEIKLILQKRNRLFLSYLKLKSQMVDNRSLAERLDTLTKIMVQERVAYDTSVVTTEKKTVTTYVTDSIREPKAKSGWKIFGRKKNTPAPTTHVKVEEQLSVVVDTLSVARQNKALDEVEQIILDMENEQRAESKRLLTEELELIHANSLFINQLLSILHDVENEEVVQMHANNDRAGLLVNQSIWRISLLLIIFFIGAALLVYLIWVDITRANYYKEQLEKSRDEAQELSQIKQRFLANMSHEIRTPLQSIIGFAEQLKSQRKTDPEAIDAINSSSEHLLHIVDEVLDYSRISSGSFVLNSEPFMLARLINEVTAALKVQAERKGLNLIVDLSFPQELKIIGDPFRLRQILYNLLGNAIKFTTRGYVRLNVRTRVGKDPIHCVFEVTDTGIGIRKEDIARIFNQFEQANSSITGQYGGTGLGLTIVKSLIEAQGGNLQVQSAPKQGSTFTVNLTFERAPAEAAPALEPAKVVLPSLTGKVIVVDDDALILRLCALVFERYQVKHATFSDGRKLLQMPFDPEVRFILMDIRMPSINGIELCHALRKTYPKTTKFVALTAHVFPQEQKQLLDEGFDAVMLKPFRENDLLNQLGIVVANVDENLAHGLSEAMLDLTTLKIMTQGDEALLHGILMQFVEETVVDLDTLTELLKSPEPKAVRDVVHKLSGRTGQVGATALSKALRGLEVRLVNGESPEKMEEDLRYAAIKVELLIEEVKQAAGPAATQLVK